MTASGRMLPVANGRIRPFAISRRKSWTIKRCPPYIALKYVQGGYREVFSTNGYPGHRAYTLSRCIRMRCRRDILLNITLGYKFHS